eukprot:scaffold552826_cov14-Prasinocladus_malaysianus.AAC.1
MLGSALHCSNISIGNWCIQFIDQEGLRTGEGTYGVCVVLAISSQQYVHIYLACMMFLDIFRYPTSYQFQPPQLRLKFLLPTNNPETKSFEYRAGTYPLVLKRTSSQAHFHSKFETRYSILNAKILKNLNRLTTAVDLLKNSQRRLFRLFPPTKRPFGHRDLLLLQFLQPFALVISKGLIGPYC